jgi:hypothetical protein
MQDRQKLPYCAFVCALTCYGASELQRAYLIVPHELLYARLVYKCFGFHISIAIRDLEEAAFH